MKRKIAKGAREHYLDAEKYDVVYSNWSHKGDGPFYVERAKQVNGNVLEIACGTGRITIPIAKSGVNVTGLDAAKSMLDRAREKSKSENLDIEWIEADCREFALNKKFDLIIMPFNAMQHLFDRESIEGCLNCVKAHMNSGASFVFDVFNPSIEILNRDPNKMYFFDKYKDSTTGEIVKIEETNVYDDASQINMVKWFYKGDKGNINYMENLHMRCLYPQELDMILHYNGFKIVNKFGDFNGKDFASGDEHQIVIASI